jgi:hypothetical protein
MLKLTLYNVNRLSLSHRLPIGSVFVARKRVGDRLFANNRALQQTQSFVTMKSFDTNKMQQLVDSGNIADAIDFVCGVCCCCCVLFLLICRR